MRRPPFKSLLALGLGLATLVPSCATNDSMMFIIGVYARKQGACSAKPESDSPLIQKGVLDRALGAEYIAALLIGNQLTERGSREQLRTETSRVSLKGAEVQLESLQGASLRDPFSATATGFIDAASGTDPALSIMYASLIPASVLGGLPDGTVVAKVRVFGDTLGGQEVESAELSFPIEVCTGCLVSYPASARDLTADGAGFRCKTAADATSMGDSDVDLPCSLGVDYAAPCTVCSNVFRICQSDDNNCFYNPKATDEDGNPICPAP